METITWIFTGLLVISLFLFILSMVKNWTILNKISKCFIMPFVACMLIMLIKTKLPVSRHILFLSLIALSLVSISEVFLTFDNIKPLLFIGKLIFFISLLPWIELYISTFYIFKVAGWSIILAAIIYLVILIFTMILTGKNKFITYLELTLAVLAGSFLNFTAIISMSFDFRLNYILLTAGTSFLLISILFYFKQNTKPFKMNKKLEVILRLVFLITAQVLIAISGLLMIAQ